MPHQQTSRRFNRPELTTQTETRAETFTTAIATAQTGETGTSEADQISQAAFTRSAVAAAQELVSIRKSVENTSMWTLIVSALAEIDSWFSGPAMTERDRVHRDIAESPAGRQGRPVLW